MILHSVRFIWYRPGRARKNILPDRIACLILHGKCVISGEDIESIFGQSEHTGLCGIVNEYKKQVRDYHDGCIGFFVVQIGIRVYVLPSALYSHSRLAQGMQDKPSSE